MTYQVIKRNTTWSSGGSVIGMNDHLFASEDLEEAKRIGLATAQQRGLLSSDRDYVWKEGSSGIWVLQSGEYTMPIQIHTIPTADSVIITSRNHRWMYGS